MSQCKSHAYLKGVSNSTGINCDKQCGDSFQEVYCNATSSFTHYAHFSCGSLFESALASCPPIASTSAAGPRLHPLHLMHSNRLSFFGIGIVEPNIYSKLSVSVSGSEKWYLCITNRQVPLHNCQTLPPYSALKGKLRSSLSFAD